MSARKIRLQVREGGVTKFFGMSLDTKKGVVCVRPLFTYSHSPVRNWSVRLDRQQMKTKYSEYEEFTLEDARNMILQPAPEQLPLMEEMCASSAEHEDLSSYVDESQVPFAAIEATRMFRQLRDLLTSPGVKSCGNLKICTSATGKCKCT